MRREIRVMSFSSSLIPFWYYRYQPCVFLHVAGMAKASDVGYHVAIKPPASAMGHIVGIRITGESRLLIKTLATP
jgi:hypothetical protein